MTRIGWGAPAVIAALAAAGCAAGLFQAKAPPPSVYQLSAHGAASGAPVAADLVVRKPWVRPGLNTQRIAALYPDRRLDYYAGGMWSAALDDVVANLAVESLRAHGNFRNVAGENAPFAAGYWLAIDVVDFQAEYATDGVSPTIRVRLRALVGRAGDRRVVGRFEASASRAADANRLGAIVSAFEQAANAALDELAADAAQAVAAEMSRR